jgi:hypothetical protein
MVFTNKLLQKIFLIINIDLLSKTMALKITIELKVKLKKV